MKEKDFILFRKYLLNWFKNSKRNLPWRDKPNWYKTFLSEIILQQTTVEQGLPYYYKFINNYPDIFALAQADEQKILLDWAGLGYYARARNLLKAAKIIVSEYDGNFPADYNKALNLPGIGPYTAAAILSIIFNQNYAVVDGNVIRVLSRIFNVDSDIRLPATVKNINKLAQAVLNPLVPGEHNEALMELGALICLPTNPKCNKCPVAEFCQAKRLEKIEYIPFKSPAPKKKKVFNHVMIYKNEDKVLIARKPSRGLLAGMWEFPVVNVSEKDFNKNGYKSYYDESPQMKHIYSHIELSYKGYLTETKTVKYSNEYQELKWVAEKELNRYAIHNAHKKLIKWLNQKSNPNDK